MTTIFQRSEKTLDTQPRRKLLTRSKGDALPPLRITERDMAIVNACYAYRALTTPQIQRLFFTTGSEGGQMVQCRERLKRLYHHGYLYRDERPTRLSDGRRALVYFLDKKGAALLAGYAGVEISELDWHPRNNAAAAGYLFLNHLLKTNDVRIAITQASERAGGCIRRWLDDKTLKSQQMKDYVTFWDDDGKERRMAVVPDGFYQLELAGNLYNDFLEIDLRTTIGVYTKPGRRDWARKIRVYQAYYADGRFQQRYQSRAFRVLTITTSETRLKNLKKITEEKGGSRHFWFTTFDRINTDTVLTEPIWQVAGREESLPLIW